MSFEGFRITKNNYVTELRQELELGIKTILAIINNPENDFSSHTLSRSNYYGILKREDKGDLKYQNYYTMKASKVNQIIN